MGVENLQDQRVLFFHCAITCAYFTGVLIVLYFNNELYNFKTYTFFSTLSTLILAEIIKLSFTTFHSDRLLVKKSEPNNLTESKKTFSKKIKDSFKFILAIVGITVIYYTAIILFGAPLLTNHKETFILAVTLTILTFVPASFHLGIDNALALFTGAQLPINGVFLEAIKLNIKAVLLGTWISAFVLPLDWDRPWQAWPIPCIVGALLGYFAAHFMTIIKLSSTKYKKKHKKCELLKSC